MFGLGMGEAVIILVVVVLLFGGKKLPELGSSMGKALTNFKQGMKDDDAEKTAQSIDNKDNSDKQAQSSLGQIFRPIFL